MQNEYSSTKKRIIGAALKIIASEGFHKITIRKIASLAEVNVAAVNYHFGSKEQLVNEALHNITQQLINTFNVLKQPDMDVEDRLRTFLHAYASIISRYPDVIKNYVMQSITDYGLSGEYESFIQAEGYALIKNTIRQMKPEDTECMIEMRIMQMMGSMAFPILVANRSIALNNFDSAHDEVRSHYVEIIIGCIKSTC
ncbi:MAG: TetR/AcrR family transcriptional regulator [Syntrophomonadaceae bacterium]|nr:TetR/AcrR family transcriptional regulator [Syntrophomonadaceae bacterium]